jgi:hypothetical protein
MAHQLSANSLSAIPAAQRRRLATKVGLFAALFAVIGVIATVAGAGDSSVAVGIIGGVMLACAVLLALVAWGLQHSVRLDREEARLDAQLMEALRQHDLSCDCGTDHDVAELRTVGCSQDGTGTGCGHDCGACTGPLN